MLRVRAALEFFDERVSVPSELLHQACLRGLIALDPQVHGEPEKSAKRGGRRLADFGEQRDLLLLRDRIESGATIQPRAIVQSSDSEPELIPKRSVYRKRAVAVRRNLSIYRPRSIGARNDQISQYFDVL